MGLRAPPRIAVIGAGIAGLSCAGALQAAGCAVTVFEKSRGPSGRMSTRNSGAWQCDHGARFFTAADPRFQREVTAWVQAGLAAPWTARIARHEGGFLTPFIPEGTRYVGVPGMNAIGHALAGPLSLRTEATVQRLMRDGAGWQLHCKEHAEAAGPYAAVLLAIPAPQAAALLSAVDSELCAAAAGASMRGCWTLMLQYRAGSDFPYDALEVMNSPLAWAARDSSKPRRSGLESWVLQATPEWSGTHLEDPAERVAGALLDAFAALGGPRPDAWTAHRWRYADCTRPLAAGALWHPDSGIGICGDWVDRGSIEG
ncbi:MAG: FAD-dependent oxidoreductase, partial [Methylobacterium sp.]|nr:FAD-dependent oxidoreductase [Methylobacterium sp.]